MTSIVIALVAGGTVAGLGYRARALSATGALAAATIGAVAIGAGWDWAAVLIAYFGASSLLSRLGARQKRQRLDGVVEKTGARDATQVMANGFPFLVCALLWIVRGPDHHYLWQSCAVASLAASAADTWATEIGTFFGQTPRSILTWRPMAVGESGGVTVVGWLAALGGALFVAAIAAAVMPLEGFRGAAVIAAGGMTGAIVDSLLGASIQRRSWCDVCNQATEMRTHACGTVTRHVGGLRWLENDGVNLMATMTGALVPLIVMSIRPDSIGQFVWR